MPGHRVGYTRVSSYDQNPERQLNYTTQDQRQQQCKSLIEKYAAYLPQVV